LIDVSGKVRHLALGAGKDGIIYVVDCDQMGKFDPSANHDYQEVTALSGSVFSMPAYFNNTVYFGAVGDTIKAFSIANAQLSQNPASQTSRSFAYPGATPAISADGSTSAILWAVENGGAAILHAYDATNLGTELYNSNQAASCRDCFGADNKFITPIIANGRVYVGTQNGVAVFGLLMPPTVYIDAPMPGETISGIVTISGWAVDNASAVGTGISSVQVKVDGTVMGTATYGLSRPDVCATYPGRPGCPNVGYSFSLNTSTLSVGTHTLTVTGTDSDTTPDSGSASVTVTAQATPPTVWIDAPAAGSIVSGTVTLVGWAIDNSSAVGTAISSVQVKVDGTVVGTATYGLSRPDVCATYPGRPGCSNVGYSFSLNTSTLSVGSHTITITATDSDTTPDSASSSVTVNVQATPPTVYIDTPAPGATISGIVTVSGWAVDNASRVGTAISSAQVKVDGTVVGTATYGLSRPDVCAAFPGRLGCPNVGYSFSLNTSSLSLGSHTITLTATDSDGIPDSSSKSVTVTVQATPPTVWIDGPTQGSTVSGTVTVFGWAIDNSAAVGTAINSVQVKVDGTVVGTATYGASRPDVCAVYPGRPGCPNVGYSISLDTSTWTPGIHTITVTATDSDGTPDAGSASVSVTK
jgi:3-hydroxymyristoyl/3-hydroxydecanoyl-(acyl carrier protein) dehydratase